MKTVKFSRIASYTELIKRNMARGKHLVQALPLVFTLQCLTGKVDKNKNNSNRLCFFLIRNLVREIRLSTKMQAKNNTPVANFNGSRGSSHLDRDDSRRGGSI